jgi:hypothetical protein
MVGGTHEDQREVLGALQHVWESGETIEGEREKTPEEHEIIRQVLERMPAFVGDYGAHPLAMEPDQIRFVDIGRLSEEEQQRLRRSGDRGTFAPLKQQIVIVAEGEKLRDAEAVVHEVLHAHSFVSYTLAPDALKHRRVGLRMFSRGEETVYLRGLDEAVIEELTRRFDAAYFSAIGPLRDSVEHRERFRQGVKRDAEDIAAVITRQRDDGMWETTVHEYAYSRERERLWELCTRIRERVPGFSSDESVFRVLAKALFTGRILEVAHMVERAYGNGGYDRLAREDAEPFRSE